MFDQVDSDMSSSAVHAFFAERAPELEKAIIGMESCESWTKDRIDAVQEALQSFANAVDQYDLQNIPQELNNRLIVMLGYISSGKAIKLLMWIDQSSPNFVARTMAEAQMLSVLDKVNAEAARLFIERFMVLERLHLLSRVFSEDRLQIVERVLRILSGQEVEDDDDLIDESIEGEGDHVLA